MVLPLLAGIWRVAGWVARVAGRAVSSVARASKKVSKGWKTKQYKSWDTGLNIRLEGIAAIRREFEHKAKTIERQKDVFLKRSSRKLVLMLMQNTPVKTGRARRSYIVQIQKNSFTVRNTAPYFHFLEFWTKRHFVKPKNWGVLAFNMWGKTVFSKGHWVKGIKARHIVENTYKKFMKEFDVEVNKFTEEIMKNK